MTHVKKSRLVPYSSQQMYALVDDIERYGDFLPYFAQSQVHYRSDEEVEATMTVEAAGMNKSFTTRNRLQANKMIEIRLVDGPFSRLEGFWRFDQTPEGCLIAFDLEFDFAGRMISMLLGPVFEQVVDRMVDAFCARAEALYEERP